MTHVLEHTLYTITKVPALADALLDEWSWEFGPDGFGETGVLDFRRDLITVLGVARELGEKDDLVRCTCGK